MSLSQTGFNNLVDEHGAALYRVAYRMVGDPHEAEDLVQETYRSAWRSRDRYESGRGDRAWLVAILRRRIVDFWRRGPIPRPTSDSWQLDAAAPAADPTAEEYSREMQDALARLPKDLRETLLLVVVGELTHQEAADLLGIPLGTVLSRVARARERLREYLLAPATPTHDE